MPPDARTTPRWLRVPVLLLLVGLAGYNVWCWRHALSEGDASLARFWGTWQMFTLLDKGHSEVRAEAEIAGEWRNVDLEALFPTRWESGPRYARSSFWKSPARMQVLAASTCGRHPDHPTRVRFRVQRWDKTIGSLKQPRRNKRVTPLLDWDCSRTVKLPAGTPV